jgi:hypothetical protein
VGYTAWPLAQDGGTFATASMPAAPQQTCGQHSDHNRAAAALASDPGPSNPAAADLIDWPALVTGSFKTSLESEPQDVFFEDGDWAVDSVAETAITPEDRMHLVRLFSERLHAYIPLFPKQQPVFDVGSAHLDSPLLFAAMKALAASAYPEARIRALQGRRYEAAKTLYNETGHQPTQPLQTLQAAACIVLQALVAGDHSTAWLCMGKAWRQAVALGFQEMDAAPGSGNFWPSRDTSVPTSPPIEPSELEQQRRTMWAMVLLDRSMCFLVGRVHAIDERQLSLNLPMTETGAEAVRFSPKLRKFTSLVGRETRQGRADLCHYILLAYMLLSRIAENMGSLASDLEDTEALLE